MNWTGGGKKRLKEILGFETGNMDYFWQKAKPSEQEERAEDYELLKK